MPPSFDPIVYFCGGSVEHIDSVDHFWESSFSRPMLNQFLSFLRTNLSRTAFVLARRFSFYSYLYNKFILSLHGNDKFLLLLPAFAFLVYILSSEGVEPPVESIGYCGCCFELMR